MRNLCEDNRAVRVSEGRRTLNEMMGSGFRVTVLKEETVMPLYALLLLLLFLALVLVVVLA